MHSRNRSDSKTALSLMLGGLAVLLSCARGQIGGEVDATSETSLSAPDDCLDGDSVSLEAEESTELGVSPAALAEMISGVHETELHWAPEDASTIALVIPSGGRGKISVEIVPLPETAVLVQRMLESGASVPSGGAQTCDPEIRIEADVTIRTENGAFDDAFRAMFSTSSGYDLSTSIPFVPGELDGSVNVEFERGDGLVVTSAIELEFTEGAFEGVIEGTFTQSEGVTSSGGKIFYGSVGSDD